MSKVWLVTGSASGLGHNVAEAVLASGDRLVATARDPRRLEDLVEKYGDQVHTSTWRMKRRPAQCRWDCWIRRNCWWRALSRPEISCAWHKHTETEPRQPERAEAQLTPAFIRLGAQSVLPCKAI
jgi:short chain dehydrogenase